PSITGLAASGPMSPSPRTAVPLVTTPTRFPRLVYRKALAGSATISSHAAATPGEYAIARSRCVSSCLVGVTEIFPGLPCSWYSSAALRRSEGVDLGIWYRDLPARTSDGLSVHERAKTNATGPVHTRPAPARARARRARPDVVRRRRSGGGNSCRRRPPGRRPP